MKDKNLAVKSQQSTALVELGANELSAAELTGSTGFEDTSASSYSIPFLQLLQSGSPQCKRSEGAFIEGATEGMLFNTVTKEVVDVFKKPATLVFAHHVEAYVEWKLREAGGGFVKEHTVAEVAASKARRETTFVTQKDDKGREILPNGNQLVFTHKIYSLLVSDDGVPTPVLLALTGTQSKAARDMLSVAKQPFRTPQVFVANPKLWFFTYTATTEPRSNEKGSWFVWAFKKGELATKVVRDIAFGLHEAVRSGDVKDATESLATANDNGGTSEAGNAEGAAF